MNEICESYLSDDKLMMNIREITRTSSSNFESNFLRKKYLDWFVGPGLVKHHDFIQDFLVVLDELINSDEL